MPVVTVTQECPVTVPAMLRQGIDLGAGNIMEATLAGTGIVLRPGQPVDWDAAASARGSRAFRR